MRIEATAPTRTHAPSDNLTTRIRTLTESAPGTELFLRPDGSAWVPVTAAQFNEQITAIGKGLMARGVGNGTRVALMSPTRYEWAALDFANWAVGGSTVAVYESNSAAQVEHILTDSASIALITDTRGTADRIASGVPDGVPVWVIDEGLIDQLRADGAGVTDADYADRVSAVTAQAEATLVYTSGTTGKPKGVVLTHENLLSEYDAIYDGLSQMAQPGDSTVMFLPLAHIFARAVSVAAVQHGIRVAHTADLSNLTGLFAELKPSYILSVPRVFEKVYNTMSSKAEEGGKGKIFHAAVETAIEFSKAKDTGGAGLVLKLKHAVFDKLVYSKLREALGGNCTCAVSGGAPLGARLGHFFRGAGVPVYEGYGLSETSAAITCNSPSDQKVGTVGRPLPGQEVAIAEDGEILLRGPVVFGGYWGLPEATADALRDGWFHTGDLGALDADGYLSITGRKKEILVTAAGKNVAPAQTEDALRQHPLVSQAMLVGDKQPFVGALITLDPEALPGWLSARGLPEMSLADAAANETLLAEIGSAVATANSLVSNAEQVKKWKVLTTDFTIDGGELTPTLKVKRNVVMDKHADDVDAIYS
ncbi:Acyl-CoA synthetase OS=Tsukamurella paurometabola (strain ATCC 8368 / DSM / CCUG 35730 / CIP 100753 / JCM 10117 / KCTC 9821 / NBRC 16120 / NCIMB 702349/ NCTC 13040) OX=521096 GN=Tpau_1304 PE=4 SV=1 [Tsukamurella paurometabola]|uniref:Acyl-CoA synthetase n=1 Tax=Tsukamurella paurometabola (strain ATCC 8368 / DSM 20162 / CCUG 35730 / CIP 100753 / JCM 10117 / KCTC 9821 / NBRC 16120 / NCIMB 702349 / NCTC 13040) TaxID=521096 RepID=D5UWR1_TSUPD|nr:long-chain fatty acid--CoA ligase [Tsukamurella paurometabola]ADG77933.1 AMP-dependent synthetase and ligase [Tsukamurella paurometabola DSM 20162]SUP29419.1 Long-chain-fatty-acid--CoA ligase FadD15 [Tsukamurella paurometabola]